MSQELACPREEADRRLPPCVRGPRAPEEGMQRGHAGAIVGRPRAALLVGLLAGCAPAPAITGSLKAAPAPAMVGPIPSQPRPGEDAAAVVETTSSSGSELDFLWVLPLSASSDQQGESALQTSLEVDGPCSDCQMSIREIPVGSYTAYIPTPILLGISRTRHWVGVEGTARERVRREPAEPPASDQNDGR